MGRDGYAGLALLAASLIFFAATMGLERHPMVPVGPAFYPRIVLAVTAVLSVWLVALDLLAHRRGARAAARPGEERPNYLLVLVSFGIFALYVVSLPWLGFRLATFAFMVAMQAALDPPRGLRRWTVVVVVAVVTAAASYFAFETYLQVLLPRGRWTGF